MREISNLILAMSLLATSVIADDFKHPSDPCPKGSHEVSRTTTTTVKGNVGGSGGTPVAKGNVGVSGSRTTTEKSKVCRENKDIRERKN